MKLIVTAILAFAFGVLCHAQQAAPLPPTVRTLDGKEYKGVTLRSVTPDAVQIMHDEGTATISFMNLPPDLRTKLGYDPAKLAEFNRQTAERAAAKEAAGKEQSTLAMKRMQKTIREVETDQRKFVGETFVLTGGWKLGTTSTTATTQRRRHISPLS